VNVIDVVNNNTDNKPYTLVKGYLQSPAFSRQSVVDQGKTVTLTDASLNYIITMIPSSGNDVSFMFTTKGGSISGDGDAVSEACRMVRLNMNKMMEKVFPLTGTIVMIDEKKDDEAESVYINLGSSNGLKKNQKFDVKIIQEVAGEMVPKTIGTLTAKEVNANRTLCKVNDGGEEILSLSTSGVEMLVNSREKKGFLKNVGNALSDVYGGGIMTDAGVQVETPQINKATTQKAVVNNEVPNNVSQTLANSNTKYQYYDFVKSEDGFKYIEPYIDWKGKKNDIVAYMEASGYTKSDDKMLTYNREKDDSHSPSIMYMIMNGQFFSASATLMEVKKDDVMTWFKSHYTYKSSNNSGMMDMHEFLSKDKKTKVTVSFMNINDAETSMVTIMYTSAR